MEKINYSYESDWRRYAFAPQQSGFASEEELARRYTQAKLRAGEHPRRGGMPVISDGHSAVINTNNEHTLIYGGTASKKTRTLILPLIAILAQARESMVILDIKGELSDGVSFPEIRGVLEDNGFECRFFNLRDMSGDSFNILLEPYRLYRAGQQDEAVRMVNDIADALAGIYQNTRADPFWEMTARMYLVASMLLMFEMCPEEAQINMLSLASYTDWDSCEDMRRVADLIEAENNIMTMLRSVTSEPEKTRMSTLATVSSMLTGFLTSEKLLRMLSCSSFDIHDLHRKPMALFLILPDEVDTYARITGLMLQQISTILVQDAYRLGGALPRRVNFVCDEFCNYYVPGMMRGISAHRSRNIRWYLVCQSRRQLEASYPREADTIMANCANVYFLNSPELSLMEYLSRKAGDTTETRDGMPRPILSVADLQGLKKGRIWTDVYFSAGDIHYVGKLPDISQYAFLEDFRRPVPLPVHSYEAPPVYTAARMLQDVRLLRYASEAKNTGQKLSAAEEERARRYRSLFRRNADQ